MSFRVGFHHLCEVFVRHPELTHGLLWRLSTRVEDDVTGVLAIWKLPLLHDLHKVFEGREERLLIEQGIPNFPQRRRLDGEDADHGVKRLAGHRDTQSIEERPLLLNPLENVIRIQEVGLKLWQKFGHEFRIRISSAHFAAGRMENGFVALTESRRPRCGRRRRIRRRRRRDAKSMTQVGHQLGRLGWGWARGWNRWWRNR